MMSYVVPAIGSPLQPDLPTGTSWIGMLNTTSDDFLVKTDIQVKGLIPLTDAELYIQLENRNIIHSDFEIWSL